VSAAAYGLGELLEAKLRDVAEDAGETGEELVARIHDVALSAAELLVAGISGAKPTDKHHGILAARIQNLRAAGAIKTAEAVQSSLREILLGALQAIPAIMA